MKALKFLAIVLSFPVAFIACKKDSTSNPNPPSNSIEGKWVGAYGFDNETPSISYILNVKAGGVIQELSKSGASKGSGNWNLSGNTFTATYTWTILSGGTYSVIATYDPSNKKLTGTWGYDDNPTNGGKFVLSK